jgi:hypothetical protein
MDIDNMKNFLQNLHHSYCDVLEKESSTHDLQSQIQILHTSLHTSQEEDLKKINENLEIEVCVYILTNLLFFP